ncbi:MAG TPA: flagellar biosynthetic protein FliO [Desulfosalsimonadaceae bacterium]|nr:flagellar biosynthetic protein FliO [Desulfosalsimonadaceae bacterium]
MARLLFLILLLYPGVVLAAEPEPVNLFHSGLKLFIGMAIVVGLMLAFHVIHRKGFRFLENRHAGRIRIMESRPVGGRKTLVLVEVEGEKLLLGLGSDRVNCLHHFAGAGGSRFDRELEEQAEAEAEV